MKESNPGTPLPEPSPADSDMAGQAPALLTLSRIKTERTSLRPEFLRDLAQLFQITTFIETGTFRGDTAASAATVIPEVHTIELSPELARKAIERFSEQPQVHVHTGDSSRLLPQILASVRGPALLWLDGHYSEGDTARGDSNTPILQELRAVKESGLKDAVVLIDDVRLFEKPACKVEDASSLHGYPTLQEVHQTVLEIDPSYLFLVLGDVALAFPNRGLLEPSPVVMALTISRLFNGQNLSLEEVFDAEDVLARAQGEELEAIRALHQDHSAAERYGLGLHYRLWHALTLIREKKFLEAHDQFLLVAQSGFNHWRPHWYRAIALIGAGQLAPAAEILDQLIQALPRFAPAQQLRTQIQIAPAQKMPPMLTPLANPLPVLQATGTWTPGQPLRLHLGCGENHFDGYVNIDYPPSEHTCQTKVGADAFADITKLNFPPQSVDEIRLHHVFEHFKRAEALALLIRWHETLKIGGRLHLETPDLDGCARQLVSDIPFQVKQIVIRHCFGSQEAGWANHYDGWTAERYRHILGQMGFSVQTKNWQWSHPPHLANVEAMATKTRNFSRAELLAVADQILLEYMTVDVPSERGMCEVWRKAMRDFLAANEPPRTGEVVVKLQGGLGNQMFQFAAGLALARRHNAKLKLDLSFLRDRTPRENFTQRDYCLDLFQLPADGEVVPDSSADAKRLHHHVEQQFHFDPKFFELGSNVYLDGYFQSPRFFEPVLDEVVRTFNSFATPLNAEQQALLGKIQSYPSVCLNVRRGDYVADPVTNQFHGVCDESYFHRAVAEIQRRVPGAHFFIFSDDVEWCRTANLTNGAPFTVVSHNFAGDRFGAYLQLMSACRHFILPNSSFGWWAAFLSTAPGKTVIVPTPWFDNPSNNTVDLLPADWIQLPKSRLVEPTVSVVIACHNYANYLPEAVASVRSQTYRNLEIILVDDGSTDDSPAVAKRLAAEPTDIPFRIVRLEDVGPSAARRFGVAQALGKYYLPLDADDRIAPEFLATTVPLLESNVELGFAYVDTVYFGGQDHRHHQPEYDFARLCQANFISHTSLIRKAAFDDMGGYDPENWGYYEDWDLWIRLGAKGWFGKHVAEPLFFYRHHFDSSLSLFAGRLDPIYKAFLQSRHPELYPAAVVAAARQTLAEMPAGWNLRPPMRNVAQLKALLAKHPNNRHVLYFLGCALLKNGAREEAASVLKNLLTAHPNDTQVQEVLKQLTATTMTPTQVGKIPLVSVIVPTYNRPDWLGETLKSILTQTYRNFEIIVVNDAGPDVSHVVEPLNTDGYIRLINHEQNKGLAGARNTGIRAARGEYIAYLDDDDIFHPNHLQTLVEHLKTTGGDVAYTDAQRAHQRKQGDAYEIFQRDVPYSFDFDYNRILWENFVPVLCFMHRKSCWEAVGGFDESLRVLEDWDIWIRMSRLYKFAHIPAVTCEFRWRTDSSSMTASQNARFQTTMQTILDKHRTERPEVDEPCAASDIVPTEAEFGEVNYLSVNPDVAKAVQTGQCSSGWHHFVAHGRREGRRWFRRRTVAASEMVADQVVEKPTPAACDYDILIPIFNAPDDVQRCVESLLRNTEARHTIYLLDDASPDKRIAPLLAGFAARHSHIKVVTAEKNGGFVANMNRGFALSRRDVVILNSDTEVTPGWLDRMDRCRRSNPAAGIVCPLSNNATILSVPRMNARNVLPAGMTPDAFANLVAQHSERLYPQIPTAIGFCMIITRKTLDTVGAFDPAFGLGYGEENDLCLRAWAAGEQSVCCDDAYVQHYGEASFGQVAGIGERRRRNAELLERRWPQYSTSVYRYCQSNPLRKLQEQLRLALAAPAGQRPHVLQVIHNYNAPGGTELHTQEIVERISNRFRQTVMFPGNIGEWSDFSEATSPNGTRIAVMNRITAAPTHLFLGLQPGDVRNAAVEEKFRQFVAGGDFDLVHFQHLAGWASLKLPRIARELGKRCVISLHDYFLQCPEYVLLNEAGERCNKVRADAGDSDCLRCLTAKRIPLTKELPPVPQYLQLRQNLSREVLEQMDAIIAPSEFVRRRIIEAFGNDLADRVRVIPHGVNMPPRRNHRKIGTPLRVGILGTLNYQKGVKQVLEAAALLKDAPLQLEVFGHVPPAATSHLARLGIKERGGYTRDQLPELLRDVDLVLIPSLFDETFCLTLSEAQALGIPVLASAVGAIPERIVEGETGFLFSPATGQALAAKLRELCQSPDLIQAVGERVRKLKVKTMDENAEDYAELYRQILNAPVRQTQPSPCSTTTFPAAATWQKTLTQKPDGSTLTSIIILTWNQLEHTKRCVESIAAHTPERHEIIFVDNGSTDGTVTWLRDQARTHEHIRLIENKSNRGFAGGNNQGLAIAQGDFILLLNNDTVVTPGWLGRMLRAAAANPQMGVFGPMSNCVSGPQLVSVPYRQIEAAAAFATPWAVEHAGQIQPVGRLVGFCLLMRRSVKEAVGGLDERFGSGNFEDDDLCIRARLAGFGSAIVRDAFVHHVGSQTFKSAKIDYHEAMLRNWNLFRAKWQLPAEASLERGYRFPAALPTGVALKSALPSLAQTHKSEDDRCWTEIASVSAAKQLKLPSVATEGRLDEARTLFGQKDYAGAWAKTATAIAKRPFHPEAFLLLAEIALAAGDGNSARLCAQHARDLAPGWKAPKQFLQKPIKGNTRPDWLQLPETIANRLTVCVITKNEEKFIAQCLKSVQGLANQIVVVDTGSTDRTVEIAKAHGAEIHNFTWCDDFSAARNAALEHATRDWVLMLDADEELPADQHANLLKDIKKPQTLAYRLPLVNIGQNDGRSFVPRLFRNAPGVYFYGRIHEQVFPSLIPYCKSWGMETQLGTAQLLHHGYTKELVKDRNKIERNLRLLQQAIVESPDDANLVMNLGLELVRSGELAAGLAQYDEAFRLMSAQAPADVVPELREVLLTQYAVHLYKDHQHAEIDRLLRSPLAKIGGLTASLHFALALANFELKNFSEAAEQMRQCLKKRNQPALSPINTDILTAAPQHCLALSLAQLGDAAGAEKAFQAALSEKGRVEGVKLDYARFLAQQNRPVDALHKLHEIVAENAKNLPAWTLGAEIALNNPEFLEFACDWTGEAVAALPEEKALVAYRAEALLLSQQTKDAHPLWERACNCVRPPNALAALILCSAVESQPIPATRDSAEEAATSKAFVGWYQRLVNAGAQETVLRLNSRVDALRTSLPTAASLLDSAIAQAK